MFLFYCEQYDEDAIINKENISQKIEEAYLLSEKDEFEKLIEVLFYIDEHNLEFKDSCLESKINYLRSIKAFSVFDFNTQKKYSDIALEKAAYCDDYKLISQIYNSLAITYFRERNFEKAEETFNIALNYGEKVLNKGFIVDVYYNLITFYINDRNWDKVEVNALKSIKIINTTTEKKTRLKYFYVFLAQSQIAKKKYNSAYESLSKAIQLLKNEKGSEYEKARLYREIYLTYAQFHNQKEEYFEANHYLSLLDSLSNTRNANLNQELQKLLSKENELSKKLLTESKNRVTLQSIFIVIGVVFTLIIIWFLFRVKIFSNQLKRTLQKEEELNLELKLANEKLIENSNKIKTLLSEKEKRLFTRNLIISTFKDGIQNITNTIEKLAEEKNTVSSSQLLFLNRALNDIISEEELWEDFKIEFEKVKPNFFNKIEERAQGLSIAELKHCAYVSSNMSAKEVASLLNVSPRSVETARYRIKKKLKTGKKSLIDFLNDV